MKNCYIQGLIIVVILIVIQVWLNDVQGSFMDYMPPIGFAFLMAITYFAQPLILGVTNIAIINSLHKTRGWQVGFWLNGIFLLLAFSTLNLILQITFSLPFLPTISHNRSTIIISFRLHSKVQQWRMDKTDRLKEMPEKCVFSPPFWLRTCCG